MLSACLTLLIAGGSKLLNAVLKNLILSGAIVGLLFIGGLLGISSAGDQNLLILAVRQCQ